LKGNGKTMDTTTPDNKDKLVKIIKTLLHTDEDLNFLLQLKKEDLEKLASIIRARTDISDK
jgi:hypothetical protein